MTAGGQKVANTSDQRVNDREVPLQMNALLLNGLVENANPGALLFGHRKKVLAQPLWRLR